ncbi:cystatin-B-like [Dysidea avara]|uniref:cystatin-B-like n=1 Tax=Dysidea avara TaxID=196820 RepID=UPI00331A61A0
MSSGPGEWSSFKQATPETQDIAEKVKKTAEEKAQMKFNVYKAIKYRTKVVAGIDFNIIVKITEMSQNADMVVTRSLDDEFSLVSITFDVKPN